MCRAAQADHFDIGAAPELCGDPTDGARLRNPIEQLHSGGAAQAQGQLISELAVEDRNAHAGRCEHHESKREDERRRRAHHDPEFDLAS